MTNEPVNIIGAGPSGLTAAIILRKHGFPVRIFEKASDVGYRLNGDFQGLENWTSGKDVVDLLKDMGIAINFLCIPWNEGTVYAPDMEPVFVTSSRPVFYLVKRGSMEGTLDNGLKEQALLLGAEIFFDRRIKNFDGKFIVGSGPRHAVGITYGITFSTTSDDMVAVIFNDDIAPKGYAYLIVYQGAGTMVTVLYSDFRKVNECFEGMRSFFLEKTGVEISHAKEFGGYGDFFIRDSQMQNGNIYIGEAAGFQDFLWGFGMRYAITSGYLAAESIISGSDYDRLWKRELGPILRTSLVNRYLYERLGHFGYRYIAKNAARSDICNFLFRHYKPSIFKNVLLPLAYMRKGRRNGKMRWRIFSDGE